MHSATGRGGLCTLSPFTTFSTLMYTPSTSATAPVHWRIPLSPMGDPFKDLCTSPGNNLWTSSPNHATTGSVWGGKRHPVVSYSGRLCSGVRTAQVGAVSVYPLCQLINVCLPQKDATHTRVSVQETHLELSYDCQTNRLLK